MIRSLPILWAITHALQASTALIDRLLLGRARQELAVIFIGGSHPTHLQWLGLWRRKLLLRWHHSTLAKLVRLWLSRDRVSSGEWSVLAPQASFLCPWQLLFLTEVGYSRSHSMDFLYRLRFGHFHSPNLLRIAEADDLGTRWLTLLHIRIFAGWLWL